MFKNQTKVTTLSKEAIITIPQAVRDSIVLIKGYQPTVLVSSNLFTKLNIPFVAL